MNTTYLFKGIVACIFALALSTVATAHASAATPSLMSQVNQALQAAGLPVTPATQQSFAIGVANGHYTTYEQLVNAMKWHKQQGKIMADWSEFNTPKTWTFKGTITEINATHIELMGTNHNGIEVWPKFRITHNTVIKHGALLINASNDIRRAVTDELRRGSVVTVWYTSSGEALVIKNMAPQGQGDYYGPVDCPSCAGANDFAATPDSIIMW